MFLGLLGTGPLLVPGTRAVLFTGADLPVSTPVGVVNLSDYVIATVTPDGKSLTLLFESNGSADFFAHIAEIPANNSSTIAANHTSIIAETGALQGIGGDLIDGTLIPGLNVDELTTVFMRSDLDVAVVPLPPSLLFMGSGLLGLVGWRRFRKG